jgi:hypothetical protein
VRPVPPSLRGPQGRSNPERLAQAALDCFVAELVIGPRFARTRWLLAMTGPLINSLLLSMAGPRPSAAAVAHLHRHCEAAGRSNPARAVTLGMDCFVAALLATTGPLINSLLLSMAGPRPGAAAVAHLHRHCEARRAEAIQRGLRRWLWIASSLRSSQ